MAGLTIEQEVVQLALGVCEAFDLAVEAIGRAGGPEVIPDAGVRYARALVAAAREGKRAVPFAVPVPRPAASDDEPRWPEPVAFDANRMDGQAAKLSDRHHWASSPLPVASPVPPGVNPHPPPPIIEKDAGWVR